MMNEMVNVMEAGMELMANGASWLFYEATTAQVILVLATLRAIPSLANILETGLYSMVVGMRKLMTDTKRQFRNILNLTKVH